MTLGLAAENAAPLTEPGVPLLRVRDVFKIYREGDVETVALRGASLDLGPAEMVCLYGPSGSGKSTLLSVIAGLVLPSAGQVVMEGLDLARAGEAERAAVRARRIGIVFQRDNLIPFLSAAENVALAARFAGQADPLGRSRDLLAAVGLGGRARHLPRQLSGGEAQRAGVAVALAGDPAVLLGDEITGELDSATAAELVALLQAERRRRGLALLLATHDASIAAAADRRLLMRDGAVAEG